LTAARRGQVIHAIPTYLYAAMSSHRPHNYGRRTPPAPVASAPGPGHDRRADSRAPAPRPAPAPHPRKTTKTARFLDLATERHGSLASVPLDAVAGISADLAPRVGLHPGPVIATSTKPDVYVLSSAVRAQLGPVHVFTP